VGGKILAFPGIGAGVSGGVKCGPDGKVAGEQLLGYPWDGLVVA
jgi:hypothetical protein